MRQALSKTNNCAHASRIGPRVYENGCPMSAPPQHPIDENDKSHYHHPWSFSSFFVSLEHEPQIFRWFFQPIFQCSQYRRTSLYLLVGMMVNDKAMLRFSWHHACSLRLRRLTTGRQSRRPQCVFCFHFFPLSVGFFPTASCAIGAFKFEPSTETHSQAIPSISSYSARPLFQSLLKNPFLGPVLKILVDTARTAILFGQRFPLNAGS